MTCGLVDDGRVGHVRYGRERPRGVPAVADRTDPYPNTRFRVEIDAVDAGGFSEVRGLSMRVEDAAGSASDEPLWRRVLARDMSWGDRRTTGLDGGGRSTTSPRLELRRGVADGTALWEWFREWTDGGGTTRTVLVSLLDEWGDIARAWRCERARPVRWDGPTLSALGSGLATETFELAHDGIEEVDVG